MCYVNCPSVDIAIPRYLHLSVLCILPAFTVSFISSSSSLPVFFSISKENKKEIAKLANRGLKYQSLFYFLFIYLFNSLFNLDYT